MPDLTESQTELSGVSTLLKEIESKAYIELDYSVNQEYPSIVLFSKPLVESVFSDVNDDLLYENWRDLLDFYHDLAATKEEATLQFLTIVFYCSTSNIIFGEAEQSQKMLAAISQLAEYYSKSIAGDDVTTLDSREVLLSINEFSQMLASHTFDILIERFQDVYMQCVGTEPHIAQVISLLNFLFQVRERGEGQYDWSLFINRIVSLLMSKVSEYCIDGKNYPVSFLSDLLKVVLEEVTKEKNRQVVWATILPTYYDQYASALSHTLVQTLEKLLAQLPKIHDNSDLFQVNDQVLKLANVLCKFDTVAKTETSVVLIPSLSHWLEGRFVAVEEAITRAKDAENWAPADVRVSQTSALHSSSPVDICWVLNNFISEIQKIIGTGNLHILKSGFTQMLTRCTVHTAIQRYAATVADVGDLRAIQIPALPPVSSFLTTRRWSKTKKEGGSLVGFSARTDLDIESLCVRLGNLDYLETELRETVTKLYQDGASELMEELISGLRTAADTVSEFTACKLVNVDLFPHVFLGLYRDSDLSNRLEHMVNPFKQMLTRCPGQYFPHLLDRTLYYFTEVWNRVILETDPAVALSGGALRDAYAADMTSLMHFFEAKQRDGRTLGLEKTEQAKHLTETSELMSLGLKTEDGLMQAFKDTESAGKRRQWICYILYFRQSRVGLEFVTGHKHLVL